MNFERLGWIVAAALAGAMAASGFQGQTTKFGTVDMAKVFNDSEFAKNQTEVLRTLGKARQDVLDYLNTYRAMTVEDAQKFRDLTLKEKPTAADKDAVEKLKAAIQADDAKFRAVVTKANPTPEEQKTLTDYNQRAQAIAALSQKWASEFDQEVGGLQGKLRQQALDRVKTSVGEVARTQGYSVVFVTDVAPYAANDLTAEALKSMNNKK